MTETEKRIFRVVAELQGVDDTQIHPGDRLVEDLKMDSLDLVELVMVIEEEFKINIPDRDAEESGVVTVQDIVIGLVQLKLDK